MALEKHRRRLGCFRAWLLSLPAAAIASLSSPVLPVAACPVTRTHGTFPEGAPMTARILSICASLLAREEGCRVSASQKAQDSPPAVCRHFFPENFREVPLQPFLRTPSPHELEPL